MRLIEKSMNGSVSNKHLTPLNIDQITDHYQRWYRPFSTLFSQVNVDITFQRWKFVYQRWNDTSPLSHCHAHWRNVPRTVNFWLSATLTLMFSTLIKAREIPMSGKLVCQSQSHSFYTLTLTHVKSTKCPLYWRVKYHDISLVTSYQCKIKVSWEYDVLKRV